MQLVVDIAIRQVQKGVFVEKGFLQGGTGQHQLLKPMGGRDALPFFPSAAELLMVLLCWLAFAAAAPLLAVWGRGPLSERLPQLVFFIIMVLIGLTGAHQLAFFIITVLVGLTGAAAASITEFHRVALQQFPTYIKENSICCFTQLQRAFTTVILTIGFFI